MPIPVSLMKPEVEEEEKKIIFEEIFEIFLSLNFGRKNVTT
jgi:hypothetical protein